MTTEAPKRTRPVPDNALWYVVHTYSGREDRACEVLKARIREFDAEDYVFDVVVPKQMVVKMTDKGEQKQVEETMYGGYLLVQMLLPQTNSLMSLSRRAAKANSKTEAEVLNVVRGTPGVINFISVEDERDGIRRPIPLDEAEAKAMRSGGDSDDPRINFGFEIGDVVTINDGPFNEFSGTVDEVQVEKGTVRVTVSFFGQDTPVELPFTSVEKA